MESGRILIVEDEQIVAIDLKRSLEHMGFDVIKTVNSGEKALQVVRDENLSLILMDISLQGEMDGIQTARIINENVDIPIVYITAHTDEQTFKQAKATAPHGFIIKPVEERELKTTIEMALFKHKMEQDLKESETRFREIFEQNFDAVVLFAYPDFRVIDINPSAEAIFQYSRNELRKNFSIVFENEKVFELFKKEINAFPEKAVNIFLDRFTLKRKDDAEIICSIKANIVKLREHKVLYCSIRDITEKIRIAEESKLLQAKLMQANKMSSVGTLASGIAHEINNPNNFIMSNTQIIEQIWNDAVQLLRKYYYEKGDFILGGLAFPDVEEVVPRLLKDIIEGARRIKSITHNLGDYSRPQNDRLQENVKINDVLAFSISIMKNEIKKHTDAFAFYPGSDIPSFKGNSQQLEQVFINLIQNALHALPDKTRGVTVSSYFDKKEDCIVVKITDHGTGIDGHLLDHITDPFFTTKQDRGGTGLGLYISYSILEDHNASLTFDSQPGKGTTAAVRFPLGGKMSKKDDYNEKPNKYTDLRSPGGR
jgi:PAS domain S-box-containing protein